MRKFIVYSAILGILLVLAIPLYSQLRKVSHQQQAREQFEKRVRAMTQGQQAGAEWGRRGQRDVDHTLRRRPETRSDPRAKFVQKLRFIKGKLPGSAPDFTGTTLAGTSVRLHSLKGNWVLINFWATWCPSCRQEMPSLQRLWSTFRERNFVLIGINVQESRNTARQFANTYDIQFPVIADRNGRIADKYRVTGIPETVLIDPSGHVLGKAIGYRHWDNKPSRQFFDRVLQNSPRP
ncbi:MAG: TlpA family protein disulfide reductase [bacterium]